MVGWMPVLEPYMPANRNDEWRILTDFILTLVNLKMPKMR
jgi:hypothetical protein